MDERIERELELIRTRYPDVEYRKDGHWFLIPAYKVPEGKWALDVYAIAFQLRAGYPEVGPYSFYASPRPRGHDGRPPQSYQDAGSPPPPFEGEWGRFSWQLENWKVGTDVRQGSNLLNFIDSFRARLEEGP